MSRRPLLSVLAWTLLLVPIAASARNSDSELRSCLRDAMNSREIGTVDNSRNHYNNRLNAMEDHRVRVFDAWGVENDRDRDNIIRSHDRDLQTILRDHDRNYQNVIRAIRDDFRNAERSCRDGYNNRLRGVPTGAICFNSNDCNPPLGICSTETGECRKACEPGSNPCIQVCAGRCRLR